MTTTWLLNFRQRNLENELPKAKFLRSTRKAGRDVYAFTQNQSRRLMRVVGRLREVSFRHAGAGTGKINDIDAHDRHRTNPYTQLIVWDKQDKKIVGGYRYQLWKDAPKDKKGNLDVSTTHYFTPSEKLLEEYAPHVIELGRSFVAPEYQSRANRKSIYSLDNLWDGIGVVIASNPDMKYLFGKITLMPEENKQSKAMIYAWLESRFEDEEELLVPKSKIAVTDKDFEGLERILDGVESTVVKELGAMSKYFKEEFGEHIPPLFSGYAKLSDHMVVSGTVKNKKFGNTEETAIFIPISTIHEDVLARYTQF